MVKRSNYALKLQVKTLFIEKWQTDFMVSNSTVHRIDDLESLVYEDKKEIKGLLTFTVRNQEMEIVSLDSFEENRGIGTALLDEAIRFYQQNAFKRLWLITTNDNLNALRFYQKRNFSITAVHLHAVEAARTLKPSIPKWGNDGIAIEHEIELTYCSL